MIKIINEKHDKLLSYLENNKQNHLDYNSDDIKYIFGKLNIVEQEVEKEKQIELLNSYQVFESSERMKMALHSDSFFESGISDENDYVQFGNLMQNQISQ